MSITPIKKWATIWPLKIKRQRVHSTSDYILLFYWYKNVFVDGKKDYTYTF
jgi:hypothetical protein